MTPITLPLGLQSRLEAFAQAFFQPPGLPHVDFTTPAGEQALAGPGSVSWQIFRNPVAMFVGGVAAVIMELAEPRVRAGVWEHSSFRAKPMDRLQRTGLAAMVTVYAARSTAEAMIARIRRAHDEVRGRTQAGEVYQANDPELLDWVHATAAFGFLEAYSSYVRPLAPPEQDLYYAEGQPAGALYGATGAPTSGLEMKRLVERMKPRLAASPVIEEFLHIMNRASILPNGTGMAQRVMIRGAVAIVPAWLRERLGIAPRWNLRAGETRLLRAMGRVADRLRLDLSPPSQACLRLGLPADHLIRTGIHSVAPADLHPIADPIP